MSWQKILAQGFSTSKELLDFLDLPLTLGSDTAEKQFNLRVPRGFAARMQPGNPQDPLLLQVLAIDDELEINKDYSQDPLQETNGPVAGLMHKYQGRVLLTLTGVCAINCRYCFRRHFPYQENNPGRQGWLAAIEYIRRDASIHEVILSGGDPLLAADKVLSDLIQQLESISHVRTIRFHTRVPIVLPERINSTFLNCLASTKLRKVIVVHCNHPQEINEDVEKAATRLWEVGCHLLNQSVLLRNINDKVETLVTLSESLFNCKILPYYLHLLDKVQGAAHFDISTEAALNLYKELQTKLPGYLLPRLAREEPGRASKTLLL